MIPIQKQILALNRVLHWRWLPHALGVLLFAYAVVRAIVIGLTYDEICSLPFIREFSLDGLTRTAQIHALNAWACHTLTGLWGETEPVLRLPSLLSFPIFLWAAIGLCAHLPRPMGLVRFVLLTLVPFQVDFFSLSRGYGEGLAFMLAGILWAVRFHRDGRTAHALFAVLCGIVSVIASYTQLNTFLPLVAVLSWRALSVPRPWSARLVRLAAAVIPAACFLAMLLPVLFELSERGEFYFGGRTGFWTDTVGSLARCYAYFKDLYGVMAGVYRAVFVLAVLFAVRNLIRTLRGKVQDEGGLLGAWLLLAIAAPVAQFLLLGTNLPVERTALFYGPLVALNVTQGLATMAPGRAPRLAYAIGAVFFLHFLATANFTHVYSWRFESGSRCALKYLQRTHHAPIRLGADFVHMPSLNYHREHLGYDGVQVVELSGCWQTCLGLEELQPRYFGAQCGTDHFDAPALRSLLRDDIDVYYLDQMMVSELARNGIGHTVLRYYPASRTRLVRLERTGSAHAASR